MGKKNNEKADNFENGKSVAPKPPYRPLPVAPPARGPIQLQPIVQPIALVPYSSKEQAIKQYDDSFGLEEDLGYEEEEEYTSYNVKRFNAMNLLVFILGLLAIAVLVLGKFITSGPIAKFLLVQDGKSGFAMIMKITEVFSSNEGIKIILPTILITVFAALTIILTLLSIISIKRKTSIFNKIIAVLAALAVIAFTVMGLIEKVSEVGAYIVAGIGILMALFALIGRRQ